MTCIQLLEQLPLGVKSGSLGKSSKRFGKPVSRVDPKVIESDSLRALGSLGRNGHDSTAVFRMYPLASYPLLC
eukprot:3829461-Amphidinium_carterae.2